MKAKRNFKGFKKGQPIADGAISADKIPTLVKYGFIEVEKVEKEKVDNSQKTTKSDKKDSK